MLYTIAVVLVILWVLGLVSSYTMGGFIHILLVLAIITIVFQVIQGRRLYPFARTAMPRTCAYPATCPRIVGQGRSPKLVGFGSLRQGSLSSVAHCGRSCGMSTSVSSPMTSLEG